MEDLVSPLFSLLQANDLCMYLDTPSIVELSTVSHSALGLVFNHIQSEFTFKITFRSSINYWALTIVRELKIFKSAKKVYLDPLHNMDLVSCKIPQSVSSLTLRESWSNFSAVYNLPSLTCLDYAMSSNLPYVVMHSHLDNLPPQLTTLSLNLGIEMPLDNLPNLVYLFLGQYFDNSIDFLPSTLLHLEFSTESVFNHSVDHLPTSITHIKFGNYFNQSVDHLPSSLTHLEFGIEFNQNVDYLPHFLTHLTFTQYELGIYIDHLPPSLKFLIIYNDIMYLDSLFLDYLPPFLTHLKVRALNSSQCFNFPSSLIYFKCWFLVKNSEGIDNLPPDLQFLDIHLRGEFHSLDNLPHSLTHLKVRNCCKISDGIDNLPPFLTHLYLTGFNQKIDHLPHTLTNLTLGRGFCQDLHHLLPPLTHLTIEDWYFTQLCYLPGSLKFLTIKHCKHCNHMNLPEDPPPVSLTWMDNLKYLLSFLYITAKSNLNENSYANGTSLVSFLKFLPPSTQLVYQECDIDYKHTRRCRYITKLFHQSKLEMQLIQ